MLANRLTLETTGLTVTTSCKTFAIAFMVQICSKASYVNGIMRTTTVPAHAAAVQLSYIPLL